MSDAPEQADVPSPRPSLELELREVINRHSAENGSDTPDFILAQYLHGCLSLFDYAVRKREDWYGRGPKPVSRD
jgi:hypothetical protein